MLSEISCRFFEESHIHNKTNKLNSFNISKILIMLIRKIVE